MGYHHYTDRCTCGGEKKAKSDGCGILSLCNGDGTSTTTVLHQCIPDWRGFDRRIGDDQHVTPDKNPRLCAH